MSAWTSESIRDNEASSEVWPPDCSAFLATSLPPRMKVAVGVMLAQKWNLPVDVQTTLNTYAHVTEDAEMRAVADWKAFTAGWRVGAHCDERIGSGS